MTRRAFLLRAVGSLVTLGLVGAGFAVRTVRRTVRIPFRRFRREDLYEQNDLAG